MARKPTKKPKKAQARHDSQAATTPEKPVSEKISTSSNIVEALPALIENAKRVLNDATTEIDFLLALAKQRKAKLPKKLLRDVQELREMIDRGPP